MNNPMTGLHGPQPAPSELVNNSTLQKQPLFTGFFNYMCLQNVTKGMMRQLWLTRQNKCSTVCMSKCPELLMIFFEVPR